MHSSFSRSSFSIFVGCSFSVGCFLSSYLILSPFSLLVMLIFFIIPPLTGRLKVIALASAVGVSAGLITLTVAIMIRWHSFITAGPLVSVLPYIIQSNRFCLLFKRKTKNLIFFFIFGFNQSLSWFICIILMGADITCSWFQDIVRVFS